MISGLNGLIGWHLFCEAQKKFSAFGTYRKEHPVFDHARFFRIDLHDEDQIREVFEKVKPHYFIHAWAMCDLDICETYPGMAHRINVEGTEKMLRAAEQSGCVEKFVYISTDHVFDGENGSYDEDARPNPKHVYGRTKRQAEMLVEKTSLPFLIIRPGLVIGQSLQGNKGPRDFLFSRIDARKPTHLFTDEYRTPVRGVDLARRVLDLAVSSETGVFHIAGRKRFDRYQLGCQLAFSHGVRADYIFPRLRRDDAWAHIRPHDLSLKSNRTGAWVSHESVLMPCR